MANVYLPRNLTVLFPGLPRQLREEASTVDELIGNLDLNWPGLRNRLLDSGPALRQHILVFVDGQKADLSSPVATDSEVRVIPSITGG